jgi:serine O-acetyltransferase
MDRGFRAVFCYRIQNYNFSHNKIVFHLLQPLNMLLNNCEISPNTIIGPGLILPHGQCLVIGGGTIGKNVTILQGVTIGVKDAWGKFPSIGDNVHVSAGAKLLGDINIGDNSIIGANAVVIKDVPKNSTAVGVPARIINKKDT